MKKIDLGQIVQFVANVGVIAGIIFDSVLGVEAGRAAGMQVFAIAGSVTPAERLQGQSTVVFERMADLPNLLEKATVE